MNSIDYAVIVVGLLVALSFSGVWLPWVVGNIRYGWTESVRQWREAPHGRFPGGSPRPMAWPPPPPLRHGDRRPPQPPYRASAKPSTDERVAQLESELAHAVARIEAIESAAESERVVS